MRNKNHELIFVDRIKDMRRIVFLSLFCLIYTILVFTLLSEIIPEKNFFPYRNVALEYASERWARFANFDGVHYISIARSGYSEFQQAFFPAYPVLIRFISFVFGDNFFWAGVFLSWLALFLGAVIWYRFLKNFLKKEPFDILLFWLIFPTSFFFFSVYTESLFFLILGVVLYSLQKRKFIIFFLSLFFLSLTRVVGVVAVLIVFFSKGLSWRQKILGIIFSLSGIGLYSLYLFKTTGDPLFFFNAQNVFGARSTKLVFLLQVYFRYLKIFLTADFSFAYIIALFEFVVFNWVFLFFVYMAIKKKLYVFWRGFSLEKGIFYFSLASIIIPTLTGTFYSIPRFVLLSPYFFIYFPQKLYGRLKLFLYCLAFLGYTVFAVFFARGYFVS